MLRYWNRIVPSRSLFVVQTSVLALTEYANRLTTTYGAVVIAASQYQIPSLGRIFSLHPCAVQSQYNQHKKNGDHNELAVLSFTLSQIVSSPEDLDQTGCVSD